MFPLKEWFPLAVTDLIRALHTFATIGMTGLIRFVQVVH